MNNWDSNPWDLCTIKKKTPIIRYYFTGSIHIRSTHFRSITNTSNHLILVANICFRQLSFNKQGIVLMYGVSTHSIVSGYIVCGYYILNRVQKRGFNSAINICFLVTISYGGAIKMVISKKRKKNFFNQKITSFIYFLFKKLLLVIQGVINLSKFIDLYNLSSS